MAPPDVVAEGCTGIDEKMQPSIDVLIVNPAKICIKTAKMVASLKMTHSKASYPAPNLEEFYKADLFRPPS